VERARILRSNTNFNPAVFDYDLVGFDGRVGAVKAGAGADVEAPAVPVALDRVGGEVAVGEGRAAVGAEVFDGVEAARDVVERQLLAALKLDGRAAALGQVLDAADRHEFARARGAARVRVLRLEGLHRGVKRNKMAATNPKGEATDVAAQARGGHRVQEYGAASHARASRHSLTHARRLSRRKRTGTEEER
jgi:hypothetical protein